MQKATKQIPYILTCLTAFVLGMKQLREPDVWWQLLSGRWMIEHKQVTHTDVFSYTMAGHRWVNVKWLYEICVAAAENIMGPLAVILLQSIVNVIIVWLLFKIIRHLSDTFQLKYSTFFAVGSVLIFLASSEFRMAGRPEMVSHLFFTIYIYLIVSKPELKWKHISLLLLLQCIWANMHEGYPVGWVVTGCLLAGSVIVSVLNKDKQQQKKTIKYAVLFVSCVSVVLINPNGWQLWVQSIEIYRQVGANKYTTELYNVFSADYWTFQAIINIIAAALVTISGTIFLYGRYKGKPKEVIDNIWAYVVLVPLMIYLSFTANRNIPFAQIAMAPMVYIICTSVSMRFMHSSLYRLCSKGSLLLCSIIVLFCYVAVVSNYYYKLTGSPNRYGMHISVLHNPTGAARFIKEQHINGPAFADYFASSYLLWSLYPQFKSYIDLRDLDVFPSSFFDDYFDLYQHPGRFEQLDNKYGFNYVVVSTSQLTGIQQNLYWKEGYNLIYVDAVAAIYLKQSERNKPLNENRSIQKLFTWPESEKDPVWATTLNTVLNPMYSNDEEDETHQAVYAANYYAAMNNYPLAIKILQPQMGLLQNDKDANSTLGYCYSAYAKVTKDPLLKQERADSATYYTEQADELK